MSWFSVLGRVRAQVPWSSLAKPGCSLSAGQGRGLGAAIGGGTSRLAQQQHQLQLRQPQHQQQYRGMASGTNRHKKILKLAKG